MDASPDPQQRIEELADQYLGALQAGEAADRSRFLQAYPELGSSLERRLTLVEKVFRAARSLDTPLLAEAPPKDPTHTGPAKAPVTEVNTGPALTERERQPIPHERALHLRCPHCGNHIQLVTPDSHEVTCRNCGSTFQVDIGATTSFRPMRVPKRIGKFEIIEMLGRGGFGAVYKAQDTELRRTVAIKVPRAGYFISDQEEERFFREARNTARLRHPGIVQIHEIARENGVPYIVSDYVEGLTLADLLTGPRLSFREAANLLARIAVALEYAHQQKIVHRDIKPSNILIDRNGNPLITDFGLARRDEGEITVTLDGQILGTPAYMPPEQAEGNHNQVDARSDVYSLGVIMYRMLTGELPFRGNKRMLLQQVQRDEPRSPRRLNDSIPRDLETICLKAMAKAPARRYSNARAFADDLERWLNGEPVRARPVGKLEHLWRWARRNPVVAGLCATIALLLIATTLGASWAAWRENKLRGIADDAREKEAQERDRAEANATESNRRLVRLQTHRGIEWLETEDLFGSLIWFAAALDLDSGHPELELAHRIRLGTTLRRCPKLIQICFHTERVVHAEFSPNGDYVVTASHDGTAQIWPARSAAPPTATIQHNGPVCFATFSPDGLRVATASEDHTARVWDATSGRPVTAALEHKDAVRHLAFSSDARLIATASDDRTAVMWDSHTGAALSAPLIHPTALTAIVFSPDGSRLATACGADGRGEVRLWNTKSGQLIGSLSNRPDRIWSVEFSPDGTRLLTASDNGSASQWNASNLEPIGPALRHDAMVRIACFGGNGSKILTASKDSTARIWDASTGRPAISPLKHDAAVDHASFSPDGRYVATASGDGTARVWDIAIGDLIVPLLRHAGSVVHVAFSPDGRYLVTASSDSTARIWDLAPSDDLTPPLRHEDVVRRALFSPSGDRVATASSDGIVRIWDPVTGGRKTDLPHPLAVLDAAFDGRGDHIATACLDRSARLWDSRNGTLAHPPLQHDALVNSVAFSPDGRMLLSSSEDHTARVWSVETGRALSTVRHAAAVNRAAFGSTSGRFATASCDFTLRVWSTQTGVAVTPAMSHEGEVRRVSFSPDGRYLVSVGMRDNTVRIWNATSGAPVAVLQHPVSVNWAGFSPDGSRIAATSNDGTVRVWDVQSTQMALPPLVHSTAFVHHAMFSADGKFLATASGDRPSNTEAGVPRGEARLWDTTTGELLSPAMRHRGRVIQASLDPETRRVATASYDRSGRIWDISPDGRPANDLLMLAELLSAHRIDEASGFVPLTADSLRNHWATLQSKYPASFLASNDELVAWHRREIERCEWSGDWHAAIGHLDQMIRARPGDWTSYSARGRAWAELGDWEHALGDFRNVTEGAGAGGERVWCDRALAALAGGDVAGYKQACTELLDRFGDSVTAATTTLVARVCTLLPDAVEDQTRPLKLAEEAVALEATDEDPGSNDFLHVLAATYYRSGRFDAAIQRLNLAMKRGGTAADWLLLAMALHQSSREEEAREWLAKAVAVLSEPPERGPRSATTWQERLILQMLRREAEALLGTEPPDAARR